MSTSRCRSSGTSQGQVRSIRRNQETRRAVAAGDAHVAQAVVPGCSLSDDPGFCRAPNPQPSHEFVERASTTAIANEPAPPQDFGPRDVGILAQPLRDMRGVVRHRGRAARRLWSPPLPLRHLMEPSMTRTPEQIRYRDLQETDFHQGAECSEPYPSM